MPVAWIRLDAGNLLEAKLYRDHTRSHTQRAVWDFFPLNLNSDNYFELAAVKYRDAGPVMELKRL